MSTLILAAMAALFAPNLDADALQAEAVGLCRSGSHVLKDMRYYQGRILHPVKDAAHPRLVRNVKRCARIVRLALPFGRRTAILAGTIGYNETLHNGSKVGKAGELGAMQVLAKYHCTPYPDLDDGKGGCTNPERAGVRALRLMLTDNTDKKTGKVDEREALLMWNARPGYGKKVIRWADLWEAKHVKLLGVAAR